ncbi:putative V-type proton ATPase subunit D [Ooceraea biroi]|uniref:Putative V-type proton ATPase subunit D n=1 Tax=Ooceraea biroi TaxID=2015173 RepID=A0A026W7J8_OOCBI|nr:putative V-type proton ATPase subunit D [Ooceraea biroi]
MNKSRLGEVMREAAFSLAEVNYTTGGVNELVLQTIDKARTRIHCRQEIIGGVRLRIYEPFHSGRDPFELAGLGRGGQQVMIYYVYTSATSVVIYSNYSNLPRLHAVNYRPANTKYNCYITQK